MFPWDYVDGLWATKSEGVGLIDRAIGFQDFQPMWSWSTNVTDRQTDGRTDGRHAISIPRYALVHRAVKTTFWAQFTATKTQLSMQALFGWWVIF